MKKNLFLVLAALVAIQALAAPVDQATALRKAKSYLSNELYSGKMMAPAALDPVLLKAEVGDSKLGQPVYYIYNTSTTFLVISGDDRAREVLMVGDQPLDMNNLPDGLVYMLNLYKGQIEYLQEHPGLVVKATPELQGTPSLKATTYGPLLTCNWDQSAPYYNQCKFTYGSTTYQCVTGCPATSAAMVMYYWKYPTDPTPTVPSYPFYLDGYYSRRVTAAALPSTTFDWANMKNTYRFNQYTTAQANAVATLMRYVGQAEQMEYGTEGSGISSSDAYLIADMFKLFGYDASTTRLVRKSAYSESNWALIIQNEMKIGRPVVYMGVSETGGHAFNVDGYRESDGLYHVNFGWSGTGNSWYAMNAFVDPIDGGAYSSNQQAIVGIQPPGGEITYPVLTVDPALLDFGSVNVGQSASKTFHVSGTNLLTDVTFTTSNVAYTVTPSTITAAQAEAGATITVTYAPTNAATHNATLYVKSPGAADQNITLNGASVSVPTITAEPQELSFNTVVGEAVTGVFNLKGFNLSGAVYIAVVNSTGGFSVNKSNVTKAIANTGVDITVTYNPTTAGDHTAQVMLRSKNADTVYVNLTGHSTIMTYPPVMQPTDESYVTQSSFRAIWTDQTQPSVVQSYTLEYENEAGEIVNTINGITTKYCTVNDLIAGAFYTYRVKAFYVDGSESNWSNAEEVTLKGAPTPTFDLGDVNHDGEVNIADVTELIDYLLSGQTEIFADCADVNEDGGIDIADVTNLIDMLLGGN